MKQHFEYPRAYFHHYCTTQWPSQCLPQESLKFYVIPMALCTFTNEMQQFTLSHFSFNHLNFSFVRHILCKFPTSVISSGIHKSILCSRTESLDVHPVFSLDFTLRPSSNEKCCKTRVHLTSKISSCTFFTQLSFQLQETHLLTITTIHTKVHNIMLSYIHKKSILEMETHWNKQTEKITRQSSSSKKT